SRHRNPPRWGSNRFRTSSGSCGGIIDFCMLRRYLYYTLGIVLIGVIFLVAIGSNQSDLAAKPHDSGGPQELAATTAPNRTAARPSSIASSRREAGIATLEQPNLVVRTKTTGCIANRPLNPGHGIRGEDHAR